MDTDTSLHQKLAASRKDLLDLTTRNRLLSTPLERSRTTALEIIDERSEEVFRILVRQQRGMSFAPMPEQSVPNGGPQEQSAAGTLVQPEEEEVDENGVPKKYTDNRLQTGLTSERLQTRLLKTFYDARTCEDEHGVNILFLALGFLKWYESDSSDRYYYAPLILVPVMLDRRSADSPFRLNYSGDDLAANLSLQAKLDSDFGVLMPELPDTDDFSAADYFGQVARAVSRRPRWEVLPDRMVLWFFSFSKFLMYRDLDPDNWPEGKSLSENPLLSALLESGFHSGGELFSDSEHLDDLLPPHEIVHIMDADSSQTVAIEEVRQGRNLVIQGPPGTGKSQTITNLIAAAVKSGKRVLFLAEKLAALEVVKRRLDNIHLGDMCLELHSHKARKLQVLEQLRHTLELGQPLVCDVAGHCERLQRIRDQLNQHVKALHSPMEPAMLTPYRVIGEMVHLRARGVPPGSFSLEGCQEWTPEQFRHRLGTLRQICAYITQIGTPAEHPWRGVKIGSILPTDLQRLAVSAHDIRRELEKLVELSGLLASAMNATSPRTVDEVLHHARFAARLAAAPEMDGPALRNVVWDERREQITALIENGVRLTNTREQLRNLISEPGWTTDVAPARRAIAAHGQSLLRWFRKEYRQGLALLRGIMNGPPPGSRDERVALLDKLIAGQKADTAIREEDGLGRSAFGRLWRGQDSDWSLLAAIDDWDRGNAQITSPEKFRQVVATLQDRQAVGRQASLVQEQAASLTQGLEELFNLVKLDLRESFGPDQCGKLSLEDLGHRLEQWLASGESITRWIAYRAQHDALAAGGAPGLTDLLYQGAVKPEEAENLFLLAYHEALIRKAVRTWPHLAAFDGQVHAKTVDEFRQLDVARINLARQEVALAHFLGIPRGGQGVGEVGVVRREIHKKRRHLPVRQLLARAGQAIQAIKPVFMMSPMSVAQFLEPGNLEFDLLIIDEASQVRPIEALGAAARCRQLVVVGDDKQLPPTRFFDRVYEADSQDEDDFQASDLESILGLCASQGVPSRTLRWHYRSRHHTLIAISNSEFYDSRLFIVPSPVNSDAEMGLRFHHVAGGVFERGGSRCNRPEALAVARAVMEHARQFPEISLGVGAFSISQRDAILDELERLRREDPSYEQFFSAGGPEPFFVKNLETIQGDERDVVFISVGYGRDASGYMVMNFGPVSAEGGERRLNVLISRSRVRCEVFSSITADDIDLSRVSQRGPAVLKVFLAYAQRGHLEQPTLTGHDPDSVFEQEVARAVRQLGYEPHPQVGIAGFFIDIAIVDPQKPGRYLLGVECDGASYHSSRFARDRDRLRQQVLEDRGWTIHRIWSTDWFYRPEQELRKLLEAIEQATARAAEDGEPDGPQTQNHNTASAHEPAVAHDTPSPPSAAASRPADAAHRSKTGVTRTDRSEPGGVSAADYVEASFSVPSHTPLLETPVPVLAEAVTRVVTTEAPIHEAEVARRIAGLWGLGRTGKRISARVEAAIRTAERKGKIQREDGFCLDPSRTEYPPRSRANVSSTTLRQPDCLPPHEIRSGILDLLKAYVGVSRDEACREVTRLLGFRSCTERLRQLVGIQIDILIDQHTIREDERGIWLM